MTKEEKIIELERMLRKCPNILTPAKVYKWSPFGKNKTYELIKSGELRAFVYQNSYIISKTDLIEYLAEHSDDKPAKTFGIKGGDEE